MVYKKFIKKKCVKINDTIPQVVNLLMDSNDTNFYGHDELVYELSSIKFLRTSSHFKLTSQGLVYFPGFGV